MLPSGRWDVQGESTVIPRAAVSLEWRMEPGSALFIHRGRIQKSGSGASRSFPQSPANPCAPGTMGKHPLQHGKLTVNCLGIIPRSQRSRWAGECGTQRGLASRRWAGNVGKRSPSFSSSFCLMLGMSTSQCAAFSQAVLKLSTED